MKPAKPIDLTKTTAALEAFDKVGNAFDQNPSISNIDDLEEARLTLAHAFADDTAERGDRPAALGFVMSLAGMTLVRRLVATFAEKNKAASAA